MINEVKVMTLGADGFGRPPSSPFKVARTPDCTSMLTEFISPLLVSHFSDSTAAGKGLGLCGSGAGVPIARVWKGVSSSVRATGWGGHRCLGYGLKPVKLSG
ncbi:hypothetical protein TIFTF001_043673 [Ficus carica]|uniref:Uncharacterized protein n=1 Tax=Ficus carica TaxID=3494 RepID=A0AA87Z1J0_FICCA|nr:hypothetical protein TIFTF001_043673 [Ficus carica]